MLTPWLAIAIGGYALAAGVGVLLDPNRFLVMLENLRDRAGVSYTTGVCVYFLGCAILLAHFRWDGWLDSAVTLVGCAAVLEGLGFLVAPRLTSGAMRFFWHRASMRAWGGLSAGFGLLLIVAGLYEAGIAAG